MVPAPIPERRPNVTIDRTAGRVSASRATVLVCELNETAAALLELCDGRTAPVEMAAAVAELCAVTPEQAAHDVDRTLRELADAGLVAWQTPTSARSGA